MSDFKGIKVLPPFPTTQLQQTQFKQVSFQSNKKNTNFTGKYLNPFRSGGHEDGIKVKEYNSVYTDQKPYQKYSALETLKYLAEVLNGLEYQWSINNDKNVVAQYKNRVFKDANKVYEGYKNKLGFRGRLKIFFLGIFKKTEWDQIRIWKCTIDSHIV